MKTLKKLFSVSAIVALLGTLAPMYAFGATYSDELQDAYKYAYAHEVTTMTSIDNANMYGNLKRIEMAKMLANYAVNVLGATPDTTKSCTFPDVPAALDAQYDNGVTKACQLGLMGVGIENFNPNGTVTRAEFGTAFSRALNHDSEDLAEMNAATPYYKKHLEFLKSEGIMTQIDNPNQVEVRGYVMLMMMRADDSYSPETVEGCTATELLACITADDYDACIAACSNPEEPDEDEVVKNGTLTITTKDYSSEVVSAPRDGIIKFNTIKLTASEPITLNTLTLSRMGLSYASDVKKVWFEKDGVRITSKASVSTDGVATVNFTKGLTVKSNETIDLVAELNMRVGNEIAFKVDSVSSTAEKTNINATTTTYRATNYETAYVTYTETKVASSYKLGEQDEILFAKATVENEASDTDINVKSITFNSYNSDVEKILQDIRLVKDGKDVAKSVVFDGKKVTIALDDTIESNKRAVYSLYAKTNSLDDDKETFNFVLDGAEGFVAYETTSNFRTTFDKDNSTILASDGNEVVINGGKVVFSNDSTFATTVTAGQGYSDVQIANGTLTVAEPVMFNSLYIAEGGVNNIKSLVLEVAGTRYNADIEKVDTDLDDIEDVTLYTFEDIYVNKTSNVKLYVTLTNTAAGTISLTNINGGAIDDGEYQNNGALLSSSEIAGTIKVAKITVKNSTFTLTNDNSSTVTVVEGDSDPVTIFDGKLTSSKQDISLSKVIIKNVAGGTALSATNYVDLTLYVGNKTITKKCSADDCEIEYPISNVTVDAEGTSIKVVVEPTLTADDYQFTVEAEGLDSNNNTATASPVNAAILTVATDASLSISASSQGNKVILEGGNRELLTFTVYAQNGSVELTSVKFDITEMTQAGDVTVTLDGDNLEGTKTLTSDTLEIADLAETLTKGTHTFVVKANVVNIASPYEVEISNLIVNEGEATEATSTVNPTYYVVKALPNMVVAESGTDNEITLNVSLPATATTPIEVKAFGVTAGTIYINDQEETPTLANPVTLNPGDNMNVVLKVSAAGTAKITSISYDTVEATPESYTITNTYTNFPRGKFQVTFKS